MEARGKPSKRKVRKQLAKGVGIERGKITHLEALEAMLVVLSDMIADVPTEARRSELIEHVLACLKIDVADEARNRAIL
jgi:hypothetical protein